MNIESHARKMGVLNSPAAKALVEKLKRLSSKLATLGYSRSDISQIILGTFLDLPFTIDWFDLENTQLFYSLKAKMQFDIEDCGVIMAISKCFLSRPQESEELAQKLMNKLTLSCELLGFDLENDESGSSEDSTTFLQMCKLTKPDKNQPKQCIEKRARTRSKSRHQPRKRVHIEESKRKKKVGKQQDPPTQPRLQKKPKLQQ